MPNNPITTQETITRHDHYGDYSDIKVLSGVRILAQVSLAKGREKELAIALAELVNGGLVRRDQLEAMLAAAFDYVGDRVDTPTEG